MVAWMLLWGCGSTPDAPAASGPAAAQAADRDPAAFLEGCWVTPDTLEERKLVGQFLPGTHQCWFPSGNGLGGRLIDLDPDAPVTVQDMDLTTRGEVLTLAVQSKRTSKMAPPVEASATLTVATSQEGRLRLEGSGPYPTAVDLTGDAQHLTITVEGTFGGEPVARTYALVRDAQREAMERGARSAMQGR